MSTLDIYKCDICGNVVEILSEGGGELVCCGKPMIKQEPKLHEENLMEKHLPIFVKYCDKNGEIRVGEVLHPMIPEHYIMFIQAISSDGKFAQLKFLSPNDTPIMAIKDINNVSIAREYCNVHGLWGANNDK